MSTADLLQLMQLWHVGLPEAPTWKSFLFIESAMCRTLQTDVLHGLCDQCKLRYQHLPHGASPNPCTPQRELLLPPLWEAS